MDRFYKIKIFYDGAFTYDPLSYIDYKTLPTITPEVDYDELVHFIETETGNPLTGIYYCVEDSSLKHLLPLLDQNDSVVFFDIMRTYGSTNIYVDYFSTNLRKYYEKPKPEGEVENSKTEHGETSKADEMVDGSESDDDDFVPNDEDSDAESVASLDHLSEGEDEIRGVRKGNSIAKIPTPIQLPDLGGNNHKQKVDVKAAALDEHEKFITDLLQVLNSKDDNNELPTDPLQPPEPEVPKFPSYDTATHWRMRRPQVGQLFEGHDQLRECLSYYALANGYSIWFERSCKDNIIARCGTRSACKSSATQQSQPANQESVPANEESVPANQQIQPANQESVPANEESVPATQGSESVTQQSVHTSKPLSPARFGVTKGDFRFGVTPMDVAGSSKPKMLRANAKVGFGKTMNWLSSGIGSSGMVVREQPRLTTINETISMTAPRGNIQPDIGTQGSVNEAVKQKKGKNLGLEKRRIPSQRVLRQKLEKKINGPGQSKDNCISLQ